MPKLEVIGPVEDDVLASYDFGATPGSTVTVSGFHGSQTYTLSEHDTTLMVRFTGVTDFQVSSGGDPQAYKASDDNPETEAEFVRRTSAEASAAVNDAKESKGKQYMLDDGTTNRPVTLTEVEEPKAAKASAPVHKAAETK